MSVPMKYSHCPPGTPPVAAQVRYFKEPAFAGDGVLLLGAICGVIDGGLCFFQSSLHPTTLLDCCEPLAKISGIYFYKNKYEQAVII